jgi:hypothetical protein
MIYAAFNFRKQNLFDTILVLVAVLCCLGLWHISYDLRSKWPGLPPAASQHTALTYGLGDKQFSYRMVTLMLQNAGDVGGRVTNLRDYNYQRIQQWFDLTYLLDPKADFAPSLAAYYYGGTQRAEDTRYLVDYLARAGRDNVAGHERWRWLAHAIYLARFRLKDQVKALELANELAALATPDMPSWTKLMPAYVTSNTGQKKAARDLFLTIAATDKSLKKEDVNQTCWYIDTNLREPQDGLDRDLTYQLLCKKK